MAWRGTMHWRSIMLNNRAMGGQRRCRFASSTTPKFTAPAAKSKYLTAEYAPIMILAGFISVACVIGGRTLYQNLAYAPQVHVSKKKRGSVPEVSDPDSMTLSGTKFHDTSIMRKFGNIQEKNHPPP